MLLQHCKIKLYERMKSLGIFCILLSVNVILLPCPLNILIKAYCVQRPHYQIQTFTKEKWKKAFAIHLLIRWNLLPIDDQIQFKWTSCRKMQDVYLLPVSLLQLIIVRGACSNFLPFFLEYGKLITTFNISGVTFVLQHKNKQ